MPAAASVEKNFSGSPIPANASTRVPANAATVFASDSRRPWKTSIARRDRGRDPREQERLVADLDRRVSRRIDQLRAGKPSAVAAAQEGRALARRNQKPGERNRGRRLAGAADSRIADAQHRNADT